MNHEPQTARNTGGIRPGVWLSIAVVVAIAVLAIALLPRENSTPGQVDSRADTPSDEPATGIEGGAAVSSLSVTGTSHQASEEVQANFKRYSQALLSGDGEAAWSILDSKSTRFYAQVLRDALMLPRIDLNRLDLWHKVMVLRLRTEFRKSQLQGLAGQDVFVHAVTNGWFSKSTVQSWPSFHRIAVNGRYATGYLLEEPDVPVMFFIYEDAQWKIALWKGFEAMNQMMQEMKRESALSEKEFILTLIGTLSQYEVSEKTFDGPLE